MIETIPGQPAIRFEEVHISFGDNEVLRGISFEVAHRETKILLGEGGSGKSVLMKLTAGLLKPDSGRVFVLDQEISAMPERDLLDFRRHLGFVFQEGALFDSMDVASNVAFRLREENIDEHEIDQRVHEALQFVEMEAALEKFPAELSGGMRRRVSIARALVGQPSVVLYDSPTAGLDPVTSQTIINLILRLRDTQGVSSLLATHRLQDAFGLANFQFDPKTGRVQHEDAAGVKLPPPGGAAPPAASARVQSLRDDQIAPTNILVLKDGVAYFEGSTESFLESRDAYLKEFVAFIGQENGHYSH
ncbi:MAG: ABC transporter ATP-binding protein [Candidatus Acidiferrales bacterium]